MANLTKAQIQDLLTQNNIAFDATAKIAELKKLAEDSGLINPANESAGIRFNLNNLVTRQRDFTAAEHGDDWESIANEFRATNKDSIVSEEAI